MNSKSFFRTGFFRILVACVGGALAISAQAQFRYAINVVGYVEATFLAGSNLIANPLNAGHNTMANLFRSLPEQSFFLAWDQQSQSFNSTNFYEAGRWTDPDATLVAPNGGFLWLPVAKRITFVGEPWMFAGVPPCVTYSLQTVSSVMPRGLCGFCTEYESCAPAVPDGTALWRWNRVNQRWNTYIFLQGEWYDEFFSVATAKLEADEAGLFYFSETFMGAAPRGASAERFNGRFRSWHRHATDLKFEFSATNSTAYALLCSSNLTSNTWNIVQQGTANPAGGVASITFPVGTNQMAFYQLIGALHSTNAVLLNPSRSGSNFQCYLYAPTAANYEVQRSLAQGSAQSWQTIATIVAGPSNIVTLADTTATATNGYYRVRY